MAHIKRDRAGQAAMADGTVYDWKADETLEVDDRHAQDLLHIADGGFSEVLPDAKPEPEKKTPAKKAAAKKEAAAKVEEPAKDDADAVTEPGPEAEEDSVEE